MATTTLVRIDETVTKVAVVQTGPPGPSGSGSINFTLAADAGTSQTISDGNTLTVAGGAGIGTTASATDTVTIAIDSTVATLAGSQTLSNKTIILGGQLDADGNNIINLGDVTFKTGAGGGTLRTGTANADKFQLQAYDVNDSIYRTLIEADAGNDVQLQLFADYLFIEDATDPTKQVKLDLSGITTGTLRTLTPPDASGTIALSTNTLAQFAATTSLELKGVISDETGSGALVFATSPTLVTPALGTPSSGTLTNCTGLPLSTGTTGTLSVSRGGTGRTTSTTAYGLIAAGTTATGAHQTLPAGATTQILVGGGAAALPSWTTATGSGAPVRATSPTLVTPALGTPSSGTLTNCTGLTTSGVAAGSKSGADPTLITGTAGTNGNLVQWNIDGDAVDANIVASTVLTTSNEGSGNGLDADTVDGFEATALLARANHTGTQAASTISDFAARVGDTTATFTNKTFDANGTGNAISNIETADLAASAKTGADTTLVTGTAGTSGNLVQWDANGDAVDSSVVAANVKTTRTGVYRTIWIPAGAITPLASSTAAASTDNGTNISRDSYLFDGVDPESLDFNWALDLWNGGTVKAKFYWRPSSGATASDGVTLQLSGVAVGDDDAWDAAQGTGQHVDDTVTAGVDADQHITAATPAITVGGSGTGGELITFRVTRLTTDAADTMAEDLRLDGILIQYQESSTEPSAW